MNHEILSNEDFIKNSRAVLGFNYCEQIYKLEKELQEAYSNKKNYYAIR